jgi:hypothetical protein
MIRGGVVPIFAAVSPPGPGRLAFDLVFEIDAPDLAHWKEGTLRCERTFDGARFGPGERIRLDSLPSVAAALEGSRDPPTAGK